MSILNKIVDHKRSELSKLMTPEAIVAMERAAKFGEKCVDFADVLRDATKPAIIAEIKKSSPSKGKIKSDVYVGALAAAYEAAGASGVSVLTDSEFFGGSMEDLKESKWAVNIPVLRKDFILTAFQIHEARAAGADSVLLIVAALEDDLLRSLYKECLKFGMTPLIEVHNEAELERALELKPRLLGINNRDLSTLEIDMDTCVRLMKKIPEGTVVVAESGVNTRTDIDYLMAGGLDCFLVGSSLMASNDPALKLKELMGRGPGYDKGEDLRVNVH